MSLVTGTIEFIAEVLKVIAIVSIAAFLPVS